MTGLLSSNHCTLAEAVADLVHDGDTVSIIPAVAGGSVDHV